MHEIQLKIYEFLETFRSKEYKIPTNLLDDFAKKAYKSLKRQYERRNNNTFRLSMSNVGRPLCQLKMEKKHGFRSETYDVNKFLFGDLIENHIFFLLHASGVPVVSELEFVTLQLGKYSLNGTLDIILRIEGEDRVYDVKSVSEYSFKEKMNGTYKDFMSKDSFGYHEQLFGYSEAKKLPAGGFILENKSTGEIGVLEAPKEQEEIRKIALEKIKYNLANIDSPFVRSFDDLPEIFNKVATGNRILGVTCGFCPYKFDCWPDLKVLPQQNSKGKTPKTMFYTHV